MRPKPYIGITGFKEADEISTVSQQFSDTRLFKEQDSNTVKRYIAMYGFLCSTERMSNKNNPGLKSPSANSLASLASLAPIGSLPMIHYYTKDKSSLAKEIHTLFESNGLYYDKICRAVQINMLWPEINQIEQIMKYYPKMQIVLQLPKSSLEQAIEKSPDYKDLVQYCLIDPSGGLGKEIPDKYLNLVESSHKKMPNTRIGIAGGLNGNNVNSIVVKVNSVFGEEFCIDAEGRLRTPDKCWLDLEKTNYYIRNAAEAFYHGN